MNDAELIFRPHTQEDIPFLHHSWATSYFKGSGASKWLTPKEFHAFHRPIRERFFSKPTGTVIVCSPPDDHWHIIGWIGVEKIHSALILQYLYVKESFKGRGIAKELVRRALPTSPVLYTHLTDRASKIMSKKFIQLSDFKHVPHLV
jgi:RimJ/RimL family protein N-acetyltransferase